LLSSPFVTVTIDRREMARRGRIGGLVTSSRHDPRETTKPGRAAFWSRFEREVDPDGLLSEDERRRRAEAARRAHFVRLANASVKSRQRAVLPA
jgi:hypothetical protein